MIFSLIGSVFSDLKSVLIPSLLFIVAIAIGLLTGYLYIVYLVLIGVGHLKSKRLRQIFYGLTVILAIALPASIYASN